MFEVREEPNLLDETIIMRSCYSTKDGGYIGNEEFAASLCTKRGIQPELMEGAKVCSIGFCKKEEKWYGWSHRAIFGYGVGSTVKKGSLAYVADNPEELIDDYANFFASISQECADQHRAECQILPDRSGIRILHAPLKIPVLENIGDLEAAIDGELPDMPIVDIHKDAVSVQKCGRGEWTAGTLKDAKQMACDFAESVD